MQRSGQDQRETQARQDMNLDGRASPGARARQKLSAGFLTREIHCE